MIQHSHVFVYEQYDYPMILSELFHSPERSHRFMLLEAFHKALWAQRMGTLGEILWGPISERHEELPYGHRTLCCSDLEIVHRGGWYNLYLHT